LVNFKITRPFADYMFGRIAQSLWDWRADLEDDNEHSHDSSNNHSKHTHDKEGVCNPLIIPHHLIASSHLSTSTNEANT